MDVNEADEIQQTKYHHLMASLEAADLAEADAVEVAAVVELLEAGAVEVGTSQR